MHVDIAIDRHPPSNHIDIAMHTDIDTDMEIDIDIDMDTGIYPAST